MHADRIHACLMLLSKRTDSKLCRMIGFSVLWFWLCWIVSWITTDRLLSLQRNTITRSSRITRTRLSKHIILVLENTFWLTQDVCASLPPQQITHLLLDHVHTAFEDCCSISVESIRTEEWEFIYPAKIHGAECLCDDFGKSRRSRGSCDDYVKSLNAMHQDHYQICNLPCRHAWGQGFGRQSAWSRWTRLEMFLIRSPFSLLPTTPITFRVWTEWRLVSHHQNNLQILVPPYPNPLQDS